MPLPIDILHREKSRKHLFIIQRLSLSTIFRELRPQFIELYPKHASDDYFNTGFYTKMTTVPISDFGPDSGGRVKVSFLHGNNQYDTNQ